MFDKVKQGKKLLDMRKQAKKLQQQLEQITHTQEKDGWLIKVNGSQRVEYIEKDGEEMKELTDLINKAMENVQKDAAKKMWEMGEGLGGLLGGM